MILFNGININCSNKIPKNFLTKKNERLLNDGTDKFIKKINEILNLIMLFKSWICLSLFGTRFRYLIEKRQNR